MRPTIEDIRSNADYATVYKWNLSFAKFPAIGAYPSSESLNLRCESTDLPQSTIQSMEVNIRGHKVKQPGIRTYNGTFNLVFVETVDNTVSSFLQQWKEACSQTKTGVQGAKSDVEATILIQRLDQQDKAIWEYKLVGCYLEDCTLGTLDGQTSETFKPNVVLSYDYYDEKSLI